MGNTNSSDAEATKRYDLSINRLGRIASLITLGTMFCIPIVMTIAYKDYIQLEVGNILALLGSVVMVYLPISVIENISYYPIMGAGGLYLSCITGNISNMKLPAALSGMKIVGVEPGTEKGSVVSTLSIGVSSIVTTVILFIGMLFITVIAPILDNEILKPGFDNIMPSLFGALATPFFLKEPKLTAVPFGVCVLLCLFMSNDSVRKSQSLIMPVIMLLAVGVGYVMYKKGILK